MPDFPFNLQSGDFKTFVKKLNIILDELFNERIGGLGEGDVFTINSADNCLELNLSTDGGLEKSSSKLQIKIVATGGLQTSTAGLAAKLKAAYGIDVDADGLKLKKQTHSEFCETVHAITDPADTPASADALRDDLVANTIPSIEAALNDIGTHVNAIIAKLQMAEILLSSSSSST